MSTLILGIISHDRGLFLELRLEGTSLVLLAPCFGEQFDFNEVV